MGLDFNVALIVCGALALALALTLAINVHRHRQGQGAASARVEPVLVGAPTITFEKPMHIGDMGRLEAKLMAVHDSSIEVSVRVYRDDLKSNPVLTNSGNLWWVCTPVARRHFDMHLECVACVFACVCRMCVSHLCAHVRTHNFVHP